VGEDVVVSVERVWGTGRIVQLRGSRLYGTVRYGARQVTGGTRLVSLSAARHGREGCWRSSGGKATDAAGRIRGGFGERLMFRRALFSVSCCGQLKKRPQLVASLRV
jgi:hypothetical protein